MSVKRIEVPVDTLDQLIRRFGYRTQPLTAIEYDELEALTIGLERLPPDAVLIRAVPVERRAGYIALEYEHQSFPRDYPLIGEQVTPSIPEGWDYATT